MPGSIDFEGRGFCTRPPSIHRLHALQSSNHFKTCIPPLIDLKPTKTTQPQARGSTAATRAKGASFKQSKVRASSIDLAIYPDKIDFWRRLSKVRIESYIYPTTGPTAADGRHVAPLLGRGLRLRIGVNFSCLHPWLWTGRQQQQQRRDGGDGGHACGGRRRAAAARFP